MESIKRKQATSIRKSPLYQANYEQANGKLYFHAKSIEDEKGNKIEDVDRLAPRGQACVYILCDNVQKPLYVGMTEDLSNRMSSHRTTKHWWDEVANILVYLCDSEDKARIEKLTIAWLKPEYNKCKKKNHDETFLAPNFIKLENMDFRFYVELNKKIDAQSEPFLSEITTEALVRNARKKLADDHKKMKDRLSNARYRVQSFQQRTIKHGANKNKDSIQIQANWHTGKKDRVWRLAKVDITQRYSPIEPDRMKEAMEMKTWQRSQYVQKTAKSKYVKKYLKEKHYKAFCAGRLDKFDSEVDDEIQYRLQNASNSGFKIDFLDIVITYD
jgi:hypothetical protein